MAKLAGVNPCAGFTPLLVVYELSISKNRSHDRLGIIAANARGDPFSLADGIPLSWPKGLGLNAQELKGRTEQIICPAFLMSFFSKVFSLE